MTGGPGATDVVGWVIGNPVPAALVGSALVVWGAAGVMWATARPRRTRPRVRAGWWGGVRRRVVAGVSARVHRWRPRRGRQVRTTRPTTTAHPAPTAAGRARVPGVVVPARRGTPALPPITAVMPRVDR